MLARYMLHPNELAADAPGTKKYSRLTLMKSKYGYIESTKQVLDWTKKTVVGTVALAAYGRACSPRARRSG